MKTLHRIPYDIPDFDKEDKNDEADSDPFPTEPELLGHYFGLLLLPGSVPDPLGQAKAIEESQEDDIWSFFVADFQFRGSSKRLLRLGEIETLPPIYCVVDGNNRSDWETVRPERAPSMYDMPAKPDGITEDQYEAVWSGFLDENLAFWKEYLQRMAKERGNDYAILIDCSDEMKGYIRFDDHIHLK